MTKPSFRRALAMAKSVKLQLASGAEAKSIRMTSEDKAKLYHMADRKQGETPVDKANRLQFETNILKMIGFKIYE
jgi:hypothetical protein